jgi:hypothetical protein
MPIRVEFLPDASMALVQHHEAPDLFGDLLEGKMRFLQIPDGYGDGDGRQRCGSRTLESGIAWSAAS